MFFDKIPAKNTVCAPYKYTVLANPSYRYVQLHFWVMILKRTLGMYCCMYVGW